MPSESTQSGSPRADSDRGVDAAGGAADCGGATRLPVYCAEQFASIRAHEQKVCDKLGDLAGRIDGLVEARRTFVHRAWEIGKAAALVVLGWVGARLGLK
jgi:hypothetical protein